MAYLRAIDSVFTQSSPCTHTFAPSDEIADFSFLHEIADAFLLGLLHEVFEGICLYDLLLFPLAEFGFLRELEEELLLAQPFG